MELFVVFETWHLGDGNYPPLEVGEFVNLSFEMQLDELQLDATATSPEFHQLEEARYRFRGSVIRVYEDGDPESRIVIVEAGRFRFYICSAKAASFSPGDNVTGCGTLVFDHYIWVEYLSSYPDPPDLFYTLRVENIWRHKIPERFISRSAQGGLAYPSSVEPREHDQSDVTLVDAVSNEECIYFVIQFSDREIPAGTVRPTFCS